LKIIYKNWAEYSEENAVGVDKDEELEKALECLKILAELRKSTEVYVNVVKILRRQKKHSEALSYLNMMKENFNNQKIFSDSKRDLENLQNIFNLISKVNEEGVFLEEEIEHINKQLNEKL